MIAKQTAIITGGSRGIGAAVAKKLASSGMNIAVVYAGNEALAEDVCEECRAVYGVEAKPYRCDVSDFEEAKNTVALIKKDFENIYILTTDRKSVV